MAGRLGLSYKCRMNPIEAKRWLETVGERDFAIQDKYNKALKEAASAIYEMCVMAVQNGVDNPPFLELSKQVTSSLQEANRLRSKWMGMSAPFDSVGSPGDVALFFNDSHTSGHEAVLSFAQKMAKRIKNDNFGFEKEEIDELSSAIARADREMAVVSEKYENALQLACRSGGNRDTDPHSPQVSDSSSVDGQSEATDSDEVPAHYALQIIRAVQELWRDGKHWPTQKVIGRKPPLSKSGVQKHTARLVRDGYLEKGGDGTGFRVPKKIADKLAKQLHKE